MKTTLTVERLPKLYPEPRDGSPAVQVSCLLSRRHVDLAITCLGSLARYAEEPVEFILHDDGSFTDDDEDRLRAAFQNARVVRRREADEVMAEELRRFPASAAFRRESCMGLKLCDTVTFNRNETYAYSDSDVLFVRPFRDFFRSSDPGVNSCFMRDAAGHCYSLRSWQLLRWRSLHLPAQVNAGLGWMRRSSYDPEFIEWFLAHPGRGGNRHHGVPEQTAWAALAARVGCRIWNPECVALAGPDIAFTKDLIAVHFVGMWRHLMPAFIDHLPAQDGVGPVAPTTFSPRRCTAADLLFQEVARVGERACQRFVDRWSRRSARA